VLHATAHALYLADEDRSALRVIPLPLESNGERADHRALPLPGPPAAVLAFGQRLLVTIRDPGMLLSFQLSDDGRLFEDGRVGLAADAWGLALSPDASLALVTSAWTRRVTAIDLDDMVARWSLPTAREPRAVVFSNGGDRAYLTHLVDSALTRIDGIDSSDEPTITRVPFPAAPLSTPRDAHALERSQAASLAYSAVLSPDGDRLFVPRHAIGAAGKLTWNGQSTVDVLLLADDSPLASPRSGRAPLSRVDVPLERRDHTIRGVAPIHHRPILVQPRASVFRRKSQTLLVASEGLDTLYELDALSVAPAAHPLREFDLDGQSRFGVDALTFGDSGCGAPSGVALSRDEDVAYVFCRSTATLAMVALDASAHGPRRAFEPRPAPKALLARLALADDPLDEQQALGRRLFYDARDVVMSTGFGCAGCHPEGRDDGHVWHEIETGVMRAFPERQGGENLPVLHGEARQTPMLVDRLHHGGRFGWRGENASLHLRIARGFHLHRWWPSQWIDGALVRRAEALAAFLRGDGLAPPPTAGRPLDAVERRGRELFHDATTGCASCHRDDDGLYTDGARSWVDMRASSKRFRGDESARFRTPPLRFVAGSEPFLHDGSAPSLDALLRDNHDRMGLTTHLPAGDRDALVAFLQTLGGTQLADSLRDERDRDERDRDERAAQRLHAAQRDRHDDAITNATAPGSAPHEPPDEQQWQAAPRFELAREDTPCRARRRGDWLRLHCKVFVSEIQQIGGPTAGVHLHHSARYAAPPRAWWDDWREVDDAIIDFPLREGERRVFQLIEAHPVRWGGLDAGSRLAVSASWLPGEANPVVTVH
jgi:cytochrome c peroxidase